ncbi:MAG: ATP-grasp protein-like protein, partial [bacterium]
FPCLVKPVVSHLFVAEFGVKNFRAADASQLRSMLERCAASGHAVMVQEIIPGPDADIYQCLMHLDSRSGSSTAFITRKLRQNPPGFGVARVAVSHAPIPEIEAWTLGMLRRIGFTGLALAEFKRDSRDGSWKLMEINGRLPRSNLLSARCGLNFPMMAGRDLAGAEPLPAVRYEVGVHWIEIAMDLYLSARNFRSESQSIRDYLRPYLAGREVFGDWSADDPRPFFARIGNVLRRN